MQPSKLKETSFNNNKKTSLTLMPIAEHSGQKDSPGMSRCGHHGYMGAGSAKRKRSLQ